MKNTVEKINIYIRSKIDSIAIMETPINEYNAGVKQTLIDIYNIIYDNDPKNIIGKYGYFYDSVNSQCEYGKLISFKEDSNYPFATELNEWKYFSLSAPSHLK
jgi:hypothetical protein